jgi:hypothetical protein
MTLRKSRYFYFYGQSIDVLYLNVFKRHHQSFVPRLTLLDE